MESITVTIQLDLRDLRYFETIAELGHLGRAAERLSLTQPALTRCVRRLEESFGTELFERVGRGIRLTSAGDALLTRARRLHVAADETARGATRGTSSWDSCRPPRSSCCRRCAGRCWPKRSKCPSRRSSARTMS